MYLRVYQTLSLLWYPLTIRQNCLGCPFLFTEAPLTDHCLLRRFRLANLRLLEGLGFVVVVVVMTLLGRYPLPLTVCLNKRSFCWMASQVPRTGYTRTTRLLVMLVILWVTHAYSPGLKEPYTCLFVQKWKVEHLKKILGPYDWWFLYLVENNSMETLESSHFMKLQRHF